MWSVVALQVSEPTSEVPDNIRPNHLIKELTKEIRYLEVRGAERERGGGSLDCKMVSQVEAVTCFGLKD